MKRLGRFLAWVCLVSTSFQTLRLAVTAIKYASVPGPAGWERTVVVCLTINLMMVVAWVFLLKRRVWAWKALLLLPLVTALRLYAVHRLYTARPQILTIETLISGIPVLLIEIGVPLLALLADRPSGWASPSFDESNKHTTGTPQSETR